MDAHPQRQGKVEFIGPRYTECAASPFLLKLRAVSCDFARPHSMMGHRGRRPSRRSANLRPSRIVDLASSVPTLAALFGRLDEMMLGVRVRTSRYVWNVTKARGGTGPGHCRRGRRKNSDQSDSSDKKLVHDDSPLSWWTETTLRCLSAIWGQRKYNVAEPWA